MQETFVMLADILFKIAKHWEQLKFPSEENG